MERKYTILAALMIILALGLVLVPKRKELKETDPKAVLSAITEKSRYLSVDQVTHRIIENDPTLMLIDLRPASEFKIFALPGAINIQPDSLLSASAWGFLNEPGKDKVLYANAGQIAEKAWLTATRYSISGLYIMKGGLNEWYNTIINSADASVTASSAELNLANFRNAARQYFTGVRQQLEKTAPAQKRENIQVIRKVPKATSGGGC
jgi:rhodanese-related sulfurtransferase